MIEYIYCGRDGQKVEVTEEDRKNATVAYLYQIIDLKQSMSLKQDKIQILRDSLSLQSPQLSDMPRNPSPPASAMEEKLTRILTLEQEVAEGETREAELKADMLEMISKVADDREQKLLIGCFLNLKPIEEVAADMHYTVGWAWTLRRNALNSMEIVLEKEGELVKWIRKQKRWM